MLSQEQRERYQRNILIPGFGESGQERLLDASVCIIGLGGLGSSAALYLAAAGVGRLGLIDSDTLELSNLQRQVLHATDRLGMSKARSAEMTLRALNPGLTLQTVQTRVTGENAASLFSAYDLVVEATDNFAAKFLINDVCLECRTPFATAGILALAGQMMFVVPGKTPCLRMSTGISGSAWRRNARTRRKFIIPSSGAAGGISAAGPRATSAAIFSTRSSPRWR